MRLRDLASSRRSFPASGGFFARYLFDFAVPCWTRRRRRRLSRRRRRHRSPTTGKFWKIAVYAAMSRPRPSPARFQPYVDRPLRGDYYRPSDAPAQRRMSSRAWEDSAAPASMEVLRKPLLRSFQVLEIKNFILKERQYQEEVSALNAPRVPL